MFRNRTVIQFAEFYMPGHKQSHYRRWFTADSPYRIRRARLCAVIMCCQQCHPHAYRRRQHEPGAHRYKQGYEPYLLVSRRQMPWYDERFRGYGFDKVPTTCISQSSSIPSRRPLSLSHRSVRFAGHAHMASRGNGISICGPPKRMGRAPAARAVSRCVECPASYGHGCAACLGYDAWRTARAGYNRTFTGVPCHALTSIEEAVCCVARVLELRLLS